MNKWTNKEKWKYFSFQSKTDYYFTTIRIIPTHKNVEIWGEKIERKNFIVKNKIHNDFWEV